MKITGRKPKLTHEQVHDLRRWYASTRTVKDKARELGISATALKQYVKGAHKRREFA